MMFKAFIGTLVGSPGQRVIPRHMQTWIGMFFGLEQLGGGLHQPEMPQY
jgi:hypothetical protein